MEVKELKAQLDMIGAKYPKNASKVKLEAILRNATGEGTPPKKKATKKKTVTKTAQKRNKTTPTHSDKNKKPEEPKIDKNALSSDFSKVRKTAEYASFMAFMATPNTLWPQIY